MEDFQARIDNQPTLGRLVTLITLVAPLAPRVTFMLPDGWRVIVDQETAAAA